MKLYSLDTETTGIDLKHGALPFIVSVCDETQKIMTWFWEVNPLTRKPKYHKKDWEQIARIASNNILIMQFSMFDTQVLEVAYQGLKIDWNNVRDTVISGHILYSLENHDLTYMAEKELGIDIAPLEDELRNACVTAKRIVKKKYPKWRIAKKDEEDMPSAKGEKLWKFDMWLPRAVAVAENYPKDHPWYTVAIEYNRGDVAVTLPIHKSHMKQLRLRGLKGIYEERMKLLPSIHGMKNRGITYNQERKEELYSEYKEVRDSAERCCLYLSEGSLTKMPKGGSSNELRNTLFNHFGLISNKVSKRSGNPSADKDVIEYWLATLPLYSKAYAFVRNLKDGRQRGTAMTYMDGYDKASLPALTGPKGLLWRVLYPSLNPTGTDTLRGSSSNPNEQNISKKPGFNLRYLFGPLPGREWWSLDYENIELRLPAYEAGETEMIRLFEHPEEAPYFGSNHLLVSHILHPREFEACLKAGESFKEKYKATLYQWVKNGNFAVQYGAVEYSGTADRAYHVKGAQRKIQSRFRQIAKLNQEMINFAQEHGHVFTMPDKEYGTGYPLQCPFNDRGVVKPTVPLNYHIQGTAMWCMCRAMVRVHDLLKSYPGYFTIMQVHDELVFDFPRKADMGNLPLIRKIAKLMMQSGADVGVPLRVSVGYHPDNYSKSVEVPLAV